MLSVVYAECHIKAPYAEFCNAECRYAECRDAEYRGGICDAISFVCGVISFNQKLSIIEHHIFDTNVAATGV
jgi:hypothetical protein